MTMGVLGLGRTCQRRKSLRRRTPLVRTSMSRGGLPPREVMRLASMSASPMSSLSIRPDRVRLWELNENGKTDPSLPSSTALSTVIQIAWVISSVEAYGMHRLRIALSKH